MHPRDIGLITEGRELLFTLVLKVGWAAALAALLVRFSSFRKLVFTEKRDSDQKVMLLLFLVPPFHHPYSVFGGYHFLFSSMAQHGQYGRIDDGMMLMEIGFVAVICYFISLNTPKP